jgi:hypothetical protein
MCLWFSSPYISSIVFASLYPCVSPKPSSSVLFCSSLSLSVCVWQRREMRGGSALFVDQAPVRAATHGRILILDGIDKAEVKIHHILYIACIRIAKRHIMSTNKDMQYEPYNRMIEHLSEPPHTDASSYSMASTKQRYIHIYLITCLYPNS